MKRFAAVVVVLLMLFIGMAQAPVQTLVPRQTVAIGQAFQVQYVVSELQQFVGLQTPQFGPDFKEISGPVMYNATIVKEGKTIPVHNYSFTLVPLRTGRLSISGATAVYAHKKVNSPPAVITCVDGAARTKLAPLAQAWPLAQEEEVAIAPPLLIVQAAVNKKSCYVGEPIVATFTLVSNVVAGAEVVKNPGFYGFSVVEMPRGRIQLTERDIAAGYEKHLLRKVQLYPMQAGNLVIDEMTVYNLAEWPDAVTGHTEEKEFLLNSAPISILVKPLPPSPVDTFTGAVGRFELKAQINQTSLKAGQTGKLQVTLSGAGNFLQLPIPEVAWPQGIEGFEPKVVEEELQKEVVPERGKKDFEFSFTTDSAGQYTIPPLTLTYFNPQTEKYETASTDSLHFTVTGQKGLKTFLKNTPKMERGSSYVWLLLAGAAVVLVLLIFWIARRRKEKKLAPLINRPLEHNSATYTEQLRNLHPQQKDFKAFYSQLQTLVLQFLKAQYNITSSSKSSVQQGIAAADINEAYKKELQFILQECEGVQYYNATPTISFTALQQKAIETISALEKKS